ncbi:uncharacterized protein LOC113496158 [Trichoplusia ni]|uniref:Uncharacterized protein LOC113496158 n=1 Tax=Trichoplusia ni TaxID=7111 RepID=A0A7E5VS53_TRINI|nr:uncharacterized protein LOC113496158 [Trichoplusia ni]
MAQRSDVHIARWLEEDREEDFIDGPAGSDDGTDYVEEVLDSSGSEYSSASEEPADVDDLDWETIFNVIEGPSSQYYLGLEGTKWMKEPIEARLILQSDYNVFIQAGPRDYARTRRTPSECFDLFFDEDVIYMITKFTNERIIKEQKKFARERDAKLTDEVEIYALLGILYLSGSTKSGRENFLQLFDSKRGTGMEAIYLTMSAQRYRFLMKNLRFSDCSNERTSDDKLSPIRILLQVLINNFQKHYTPGHEMALSHTMIPFKGRCGFRHHVPKKPFKYALKMFNLVDCYYPYTYNLELYLGENPGPYDIGYSKLDTMVRITDPIQGEYRNLTLTNYFTSLESVEMLFDKKITAVGSIKPTKKEVPRIFRTVNDKMLYNSLFGFGHAATLVQYICKPDKAVLLLSSKHSDCSIDMNSGLTFRPDIMTYYKRTKSSVEVLEKLCARGDVTRNSRRWALTVFFRLMNIAAVNALCVYTINKRQERVVRREFQIEMALSMIRPMIQRRMHSDNIPKIVKQKMCEFLNVPIPIDVELQIDLTDHATCTRTGPRGRCHVCRRARSNKTTREVCASCNRFTCFAHSKYVCNNCYGK